MHGTWTPHLVMDGFEWFATTRYLTSLGDWSLNWYDKCVYIDIWAECKILHDVVYSTFAPQKSNRIQSNCQPQPTHDTCLFKSWGIFPKKIHHVLTFSYETIYRILLMTSIFCSDLFPKKMWICSKKMWSVCCGHNKWLVPNTSMFCCVPNLHYRWLAWLLFTRPVMRCLLGPRRCLACTLTMLGGEKQRS